MKNTRIEVGALLRREDGEEGVVVRSSENAPAVAVDLGTQKVLAFRSMIGPGKLWRLVGRDLVPKLEDLEFINPNCPDCYTETTADGSSWECSGCNATWDGNGSNGLREGEDEEEDSL